MYHIIVIIISFVEQLSYAWNRIEFSKNEIKWINTNYDVCSITDRQKKLQQHWTWSFFHLPDLYL